MEAIIMLAPLSLLPSPSSGPVLHFSSRHPPSEWSSADYTLYLPLLGRSFAQATPHTHTHTHIYLIK